MSKAKFQPMPMANEAGDDGDGSNQPCVRLRQMVGASEVVGAGVSWAACSISMTLLNKVAVGKSHAPIAVVVMQMLATVGIALASNDVRFGAGTRTWALAVPPLFALMMITSMIALKYVTVGTFVVVRNLGPVVTLVVETLVHKPEHLKFDWQSAAATSAIAIGVLIYEARELSFSFFGFVFLIANLALSCAERMLQRHLLAVSQVDVSKPGLMVLNNGLGALFCLLIMGVAAPNEAHALYHALRFKRGTGSAVLASCVVGCGISYTGLWLQKLVTATTFMVLGSFTKMIVIVWGMLVMNDAHGPWSVAGALLSIGGSYAYARLPK